MKKMKFILQKEFRQIFRDKTILAMMFVLPLVQLGILPMAMNFDVKYINLAVVDHDHSTLSDKLVQKIASSGYFKIIAAPIAYKKVIEYIEKGDADMILEIPNDFERNLTREGIQKLNLSVDAINGTKSGLGSSYLTSVIQDFNNDIQVHQAGKTGHPVIIDVTSSTWFNPHANFKWFIVPGVMVLLLTIVGGFISALNIVREKEAGTIEQINVTPIKKWQFILGKLIPFWVVGIIILTLGLLVARIFYGIIPLGNIFLIYLLAAIYLIALLGFGLFISTFSETQLQSMFVAFFFIMIFILMSGLFTSVESMPTWARNIANLLPITHFMKAMRMIILKGSGFFDVVPIMLYELGFAVLLNGLAVWNYHKTS